MEMFQRCPECGAARDDEKSCQDRFHQLLAWEWEDPRNLVVHHLMVLSYHLQHPSLYSPEGLTGAKQLLFQFLERGVSPGELRRRNRAELDSGHRPWKIKGMAASHGSYDPPIRWTMTTIDVIAGGIDSYCDKVRAWAWSIFETLKVSGNYPSP